MSQPTPQPPNFPTQPPPQQPKKNRLPLIIGGAVALVVVIVATVIGTLALTGRSGQTSAAAAQQQPATQPTTDQDVFGEDLPDAPTTEPTTGPTPTVKDFALTPKVTDKNCFGDAGCSVEFQVKLEYVGPLLSESDTWLVTYQVTGVEDSPMIGSLELTGDTYQMPTESASTKSSKSKILIKVTDVEKVGL